MSTDFRGREGGKSESGVNDHTVNRPKLPDRDRTRAWSFLSVMMHAKMKVWILRVELYTYSIAYIDRTAS